MPPTSILLATDLSHRCDRALDRAAMLAGAWKARLVVLHVLEEPSPVTDAPSWRRPADPRAAALDRVRRDLGEAARDLEVEIVVERGEPAPVILEKIERLGCELVLTGVARDEALGRLFLGGTVERLARAARVPLLVVKSRPRRPYGHVVVATDFSEGSRDALEAALEIVPDAQVTLFHAYDVPLEGFIDDKMAAREAAAQRALAESGAFLAATPAVQAHARPIATLCEYGDVAALLEELVVARNVDLVALGTEGRSGLAKLLLGSVAERLLHRIPVDVLLVRRRRT